MNLRNKPCSCGSGKKYKRCCGDNVGMRRPPKPKPEEVKGKQLSQTFRKETRMRQGIRGNRMGMVAPMILAAMLSGRR